MSANSKGSGETALKRRLARAFAGRLCDKCPFIVRWLNERLSKAQKKRKKKEKGETVITKRTAQVK